MKKLWLKIKGSVRSWTIWLNGAALLLLEFAPDLLDYLPTMQGHFDDALYEVVLKIALVANLVLRFKTKRDLIEKVNK